MATIRSPFSEPRTVVRVPRTDVGIAGRRWTDRSCLTVRGTLATTRSESGDEDARGAAILRTFPEGLPRMRQCGLCSGVFDDGVEICPHDDAVLLDPDPMLGRTLNNGYRVDAFLGRGGMASVYRGDRAGWRGIGDEGSYSAPDAASRTSGDRRDPRNRACSDRPRRGRPRLHAGKAPDARCDRGPRPRLSQRTHLAVGQRRQVI